MKKLICFIFSITILITVISSCGEDDKRNSDFVKLISGEFYLRDKPFIPLVLNYRVSLLSNKNEIWPAPYKGYYNGSHFRAFNIEASLKDMESDFQLIKDLGFNCVRLVGIGEQFVKDTTNGVLALKAFFDNDKEEEIILNGKNYELYTKAIDDVLKIAKQKELKVIFLMKVSPEIPATEAHLERILKTFKDKDEIFAYDFFNEPLYFDKPERDKMDMFAFTKRWYEIFKKNAPNQLCTVGLTGVREVLAWDPNLVNVDFLSMHPYEYEPKQVRNEIYWYGKYIKKPWIIGETSLPADGDSVNYDIQKHFAEATLAQTFSCGGKGYSWWQYKDVEWDSYHMSFMGVLNRKGETNTSASEVVQGTLKPVAMVFKSTAIKPDSVKCICLENYYNYSVFKKYKLRGRIVDDNSKPIEGAIILGWNEDWSKSYHTISKSDGTFDLMGPFPFYHWRASSTIHTVVRGDLQQDLLKIGIDSVPYINIETLTVKKINIRQDNIPGLKEN